MTNFWLQLEFTARFAFGKQPSHDFTDNRKICKQRRRKDFLSHSIFSLGKFSHFVDFSDSRSFYLHFQHRTFWFSHTKTFIFFFFFVGERRKFPHEKYFPNDWFSLRLHLHDSRRVFVFWTEKKVKNIYERNLKGNWLINTTYLYIG